MVKNVIKKEILYYLFCIVLFFISFLIALLIVRQVTDETVKLTIYWVIGFLDCAITRTVDDLLNIKFRTKGGR